MNPQSDPASNFLVGIFSFAVRIILTPFYYAARSDMGIQWTAAMPMLIGWMVYAPACAWFVRLDDVNASVVRWYALLVLLGFIRNAIQARQRRRLRDWGVHSWSVGETLIEPALLLICRMLYRNWGAISWVKRVTFKILSGDFIYYIAEPMMLLFAARALWSIGSTLWFYPLILSAALVAARSEMQLSLYLRAHEVMDGKKLERAITGMLENPTPGRSSIPVAQIPAASGQRVATDDRSVFDRLSPDLQMLLMRDRATRH